LYDALIICCVARNVAAPVKYVNTYYWARLKSSGRWNVCYQEKTQPSEIKRKTSLKSYDTISLNKYFDDGAQNM
jgi:hypothetical protein